MSEKKFDEELVVRRPRSLVAIGGLGFAFAIGLLLLGFAAAKLAGLAQIAFIIGVGFPWLVNRSPRVERSRVRATREGLVIDEKLYPRKKIQSSVVVHDGDDTYARFEFGMSRRVDVRVADEAQAADLFAAAGVDALSSTSELTLYTAKKFQWLLMIPLLGIVVATSLTHAALANQAVRIAPFVSALVAMPFVWLVMRMRRVKILVGADGIRISDGLREPLFLPHNRIADVRAEEHFVVLTLKTGEELSYITTTAKTPGLEHYVLARSIVRRIGYAREAYAKLDAASEDALVLARGDRTPADWILALRRLGEEGGASFRQMQAPREALLRMIEGTRASALERIAALVALKSTMTEEEAPRVRVAIDRCAETSLRDRMRVVIDAGDEAAVERVLEETEQAEKSEGRDAQSASKKAVSSA